VINDKFINEYVIALKSAKYEHKSYYLSDENIAEAMLEHTIKLIEGYLRRCENVSDSNCMTWWKHEECLTLQGILFDITGDEKYMRGSMHSERAWLRK
jgi:hypothetical protein